MTQTQAATYLAYRKAIDAAHERGDPAAMWRLVKGLRECETRWGEGWGG